MIYKYRFSEKAISDLESIWLYTFKKWSKEQADRYHDLIIQEIEYAINHYDSCRNMDHVRAGYKMAKVKSHLIFFRESTDDFIEIIRILHQRMDFKRRLKEDI